MSKQDKLIKLGKELVNLFGVNTQAIKDVAQDNLFTIDMVNMGLRVYEWEGLPQGIDKRTIERILFFRGKAVFFKHPTLGYFCLPFVYKEQINANGFMTKVDPISVATNSATASDFANLDLEDGVNCVIIRDNELEVPPIMYARLYGEMLNTLYDDREINNMWLRIPMIFGIGDGTDLKGKGTDTAQQAKNALVLKDIMLGQGQLKLPYITDVFKNLQAINVKQPYIGAEIYEQIKTVKNDWHEFLGIYQENDKKERVITGEQEANCEAIDLHLDKRKVSRDWAIAKIKELFPDVSLSLKVNKATYLRNQENSSTTVISHGGKP